MKKTRTDLNEPAMSLIADIREYFSQCVEEKQGSRIFYRLLYDMYEMSRIERGLPMTETDQNLLRYHGRRIFLAAWTHSRVSHFRNRRYFQDVAVKEEFVKHTAETVAEQHVFESLDPTVYILELENGRAYVGRSCDVERSVREHMNGKGIAFLNAFKPTGRLLPRLGNVSGRGEAAIRDETIRYMRLLGIARVRGWKYTRLTMSNEEFKEAIGDVTTSVFYD
jgi:predicted GIY-YIG superfamily endonuclease